ncbi:MAG: heme-dependent oxidative N-demethylase subunit alpha family protein [Chloroflexota bacterium]
MQLPPVREPFPVKTPFITATDMYKLGRPVYGYPEDTVFLFDAAFAPMIDEKLAVFSQYGHHSLLYLDDDIPTLEGVLWQIAEAVGREFPAYFTCYENGFRSRLTGVGLRRDGSLTFDVDNAVFPELGQDCYDYLDGLGGTMAHADRLCAALALSVQEDLAIMRNRTGEPNADEAEALLVALPTHWDPAEKLGLSFHDIHVPVGDNDRLLRASPRLMKAMIGQGPFVRYNWSLTSTKALAQNPVMIHGHSLENMDTVPEGDALLDMLYFRSERQTLIPFPDVGRALFTIRIFQRPLKDALKTREHVQRVADAVESMTPGHIAYRGMENMVDNLVRALRGYEPPIQKSGRV